METRTRRLVLTSMLFLFLGARAMADDVGGAVAAPAAPRSNADLAQEDRIAELERMVGVLADELERTRADLAVPEEPELLSSYGLGPAASKVYGIERGLSIGGYGEGFYRKIVGGDGSDDRADYLRGVLYFGYKFTDRILFNTEIEFEHATTGSTVTSGGGSASVEFAYLDFMLNDWVNARAGLLLVPMGFLNEIHEPPFYYGVNRPEVERRILPTTWRENGVGIFGNLGEQVSYKLYAMNGFNAQGFDSSGLRGGRQKGNRALAEDLVVVGQLHWSPAPEWLLGGAVYHGNSGQNQTESVSAAGGGTYTVQVPDTPTTVWELHAQYQNWGLHLRGLFTMAHLGDARDLTAALGPVGTAAMPGGTGALSAGEAIAEDMLGGYGEVAYDILPLIFPDTNQSLEPFFRYEYLDTQYRVPSGLGRDDAKAIRIMTAGLSYMPISRVVLKFDYRNRAALDGAALSDEVNLGMGFVF